MSRTFLFAGDAEAREEEYMANGLYIGLLTVARVHEYKTPDLRFRTLLTKDDAWRPRKRKGLEAVRVAVDRVNLID